MEAMNLSADVKKQMQARLQAQEDEFLKARRKKMSVNDFEVRNAQRNNAVRWREVMAALRLLLSPRSPCAHIFVALCVLAHPSDVDDHWSRCVR